MTRDYFGMPHSIAAAEVCDATTADYCKADGNKK